MVLLTQLPLLLPLLLLLLLLVTLTLAFCKTLLWLLP
jgi:hypothetical protein